MCSASVESEIMIHDADHANQVQQLLPSHLNCTEFLVYDLDHALNFFSGHGSGTTLLSKEIHDVGGELVAALVVLFNLLLVNGSDLSELILVVRMLNSCAILTKVLWGCCAFFGAHNALSYQHVVQPHQLGVGGIVVLDIAEAQHCSLFDLAQHGEEGRLHSVAIERVFSCLVIKYT